jgi:S-adenosyl-L-methionine hydrolase (adenosine-forming)
MKGVILHIAPEATIVDLSHEIGAQDIWAGAFVLRHAAREFPAGSLHCAVIDPGVGTARRALAFSSDDHIWIGPDNGLLSFALQRATSPIYHVTNPLLSSGRASNTFHGRDLFAPTAAHLARDLPLNEVGPPISDPVHLPVAPPRLCNDALYGQIIHIDHFGNLVSNLAAKDLAPFAAAPLIRIGSAPPLKSISTTYADVAPGQPLALLGSADLLEISIRDGHAAHSLQLERGAVICIEHQST